MSLKIRLTLLYISIFGGIMILFSVAIFGLATVVLLQQLDATLERTWFDVQRVTRVSGQGELEMITDLSLDSSVFVQAWDRSGNLIANSFTTNQLLRPLDPVGLQSAFPVFRESQIDDVALRVLSVPVEVGGRPSGTVQIGVSMTEVNTARQTLLGTLSVASIISIVFAGLIGWLSTRQSLAPLEAATRAALQITQTVDISRRIPQSGPSENEVGQLVQAFNLNLDRLERLIETQRRFVADVGHELRTPLTVIKGNVDLMRRIQETDEESLESIEGEVDRLTRLVGDLMLLAQAEAGKMPIANALVDLDTVLLDVFRQMKVLAGDHIDLQIGAIDQVLVCGDRDRLKQVFLNLISNGIKYTPKGGEVVVSLGKVGKQAQLTVSDNGPGIPADDLPHVFERFYRAEKSRVRSRDGKGFGLGLSIAYWIVKNHDGQIDVSSTMGKGTTFSVHLPLSDGNCLEG
jgi:signal transduction histidine kinase